MAIKKLQAKYGGKCQVCSKDFEIGDQILWDPTSGNKAHERCGMVEFPVRVRKLEGSEFDEKRDQR
jgi:hypothetical protein